ncbi:putative uncharacterized protein C6orf52 homolog [Mus caroli]|uniref:tRNA selenocysteine 1-associated protein 1 C-terminal domain-containing protein n=1 Tax=Mus caroli TaxID=10089 RepID=A0A6P5QXR2_MUSCR|nr:putative uncharacterized protein C6orf52 homolog [Mus caroli]
MAEGESTALEYSGKECVCGVIPVTSCPLPSDIREQLRFHYSLECCCDNHFKQLHSFSHLSCYSYGSTGYGNGPSPLCESENPEPIAGPETPARPDDSMRHHARLHLNIEESNKEFVAESEELYNSVMKCHWQPLDAVLSNIPDELPTLGSNPQKLFVNLNFWDFNGIGMVEYDINNDYYSTANPGSAFS